MRGSKAQVRKKMKDARAEHVAELPDQARALIFNRPPGIVVERVPESATIGLYMEVQNEAPASGYARFFHERGHTLALPYFHYLYDDMDFARWNDPYQPRELTPGPFGARQPKDDAESVVPDVLIMPLVAFTERCERLGQGGGHYDRWLAAHPDTLKIGLAWDIQKADYLPLEPHDIALDMIVTPTRAYEAPK